MGRPHRSPDRADHLGHHPARPRRPDAGTGNDYHNHAHDGHRHDVDHAHADNHGYWHADHQLAVAWGIASAAVADHAPSLPTVITLPPGL